MADETSNAEVEDCVPEEEIPGDFTEEMTARESKLNEAAENYWRLKMELCAHWKWRKEDVSGSAVAEEHLKLEMKGSGAGAIAENSWKSEERLESDMETSEGGEIAENSWKSEERLKSDTEASGGGEIAENSWKSGITGGDDDGGEEEIEERLLEEERNRSAMKLPHQRVPQPEDFHTEALQRL